MKPLAEYPQMGVSAFVLVMTNFIMNVAAIAITLPVSLVMARYLGVAPDVIFFSALAGRHPAQA